MKRDGVNSKLRMSWGFNPKTRLTKSKTQLMEKENARRAKEARDESVCDSRSKEPVR